MLFAAIIVVFSLTTYIFFFRWPAGGKSPDEDVVNDIMTTIRETEKRIVSHFDEQLNKLQSHLDMRLDSLYDTIVSLRPQNFVEANDFSGPNDTEV